MQHHLCPKVGALLLLNKHIFYQLKGNDDPDKNHTTSSNKANTSKKRIN